ncbi:MAG: TSUP family transporter [Megasphaera sp.]|jgi:uncharacterized membrane protein YfcA|nr:TSUP family transporter [Megasphaera sp.]MCH4187964.1 TSUP family transporter [Megasphaera sp.]MCH4217684.1 TSUP family transporter [Megasphaera sp.]
MDVFSIGMTEGISWGVLLFIMAGGFLAGFIDAIAGGGGLISLPVLMAAGLPPHMAVGTNKFAATFGAIMSAWQFVKAGKVDSHLMKRLVPLTFIGAVAGCAVMVSISAQWLQPIIIASLIGTAVFVFTRRNLGSHTTYGGETRRNLALSAAAALFIGFYDGFIGPGTGTFYIVFFAMIGFDFVMAAGNAKILNLTSNITSFVLFIYWDKIIYIYGAVMAVCIFCGAYFGSRLAIRKGSSFIRVIMLTVTTLLIGKLALSYAGML